VIPILVEWSSHTRNRTYSFLPTHRNEMNLIVGALFPCTVVAVVTVVVVLLPATTDEALEATVDTPPDVIAVTSARRR
jgi:hypothetical protein